MLWWLMQLVSQPGGYLPITNRKNSFVNQRPTGTQVFFHAHWGILKYTSAPIGRRETRKEAFESS